MRISDDETRAKLEKLIRLLGWKFRLRPQRHMIGNDAPRELRGQIIKWYEAGKSTSQRGDCFIQINEDPIGQKQDYAACVFAIRYRLCTGWHGFRLARTEVGLKRVAERLSEWLDWRWFATLDGRRAFRHAHREQRIQLGKDSQTI